MNELTMAGLFDLLVPGNIQCHLKAFYNQHQEHSNDDHLHRCVNTLRPRQNGRHFADIFKCIFLNENVWISLKISLKFVPKGSINNIPALVQIMAWCHSGDKPLSEPMMLVYQHIYASLSLNELSININSWTYVDEDRPYNISPPGYNELSIWPDLLSLLTVCRSCQVQEPKHGLTTLDTSRISVILLHLWSCLLHFFTSFNSLWSGRQRLYPNMISSYWRSGCQWLNPSMISSYWRS